LPDYSVVVFDEAHELEDVATQYFGTMVSNYRLEEFVRDSDKALREAGNPSTFLPDQLARLSADAGKFFDQFRGKEGRYSLRDLGEALEVRRGPVGEVPGLAESYRALLGHLAVVQSGLSSLANPSDEIEALVRRSAELQDEMSAILESVSSEHVYWYELRGRGVFLWASPIRVADLLRERLFSAVDCAVLTSATLSTEGNFQFIRSRLGLDRAEELILGSHFDFRSQAILYIPRDLPEPREKEWIGHACDQLEEILAASQGRAFVLFTSHFQMRQVHRALKSKLPFPMLLQGDGSRAGLLEEFRRTPNCVLFATSSFWQGVDVQGDQLSCVVIDKLPFSVPSDPVVAARIRHLNESGGNAFYEYQIPEAIILLKQGLGRLIRSRTDHGILALLDKRVITRPYGRSFLASLPPTPITHEMTEVRSFFEKRLKR